MGIRTARKNKDINIIILMLLAVVFLALFIVSFFHQKSQQPTFGVLPVQYENLSIMLLSMLSIVKVTIDIAKI